MIIFNILCNEGKKEIFDKFYKYEGNIPNPFNPLAEYSDPRVGVHVEIGGNSIKGYYEDGKFEHRGNLMRGKNFFWIYTRKSNESIKLKVIITFAPFFVLIVLLSNLVALLLFDNEIVYVITEFVLLFFFLKDKIYEEQLEIKDIIERICQN